MEHLLELSRLLDRYGQMLTERQRRMVDDYANANFSLAEIAENAGITRQGVRDTLVRAEQQLRGYEERLGLVQKLDRQQMLLSQLDRMIGKLPDGGEKQGLCTVAEQLGAVWEDD